MVSKQLRYHKKFSARENYNPNTKMDGLKRAEVTQKSSTHRRKY